MKMINPWERNRCIDGVHEKFAGEEITYAGCPAIIRVRRAHPDKLEGRLLLPSASAQSIA